MLLLKRNILLDQLYLGAHQMFSKLLRTAVPFQQQSATSWDEEHGASTLGACSFSRGVSRFSAPSWKKLDCEKTRNEKQDCRPNGSLEGGKHGVCNLSKSRGVPCLRSCWEPSPHSHNPWVQVMESLVARNRQESLSAAYSVARVDSPSLSM